MKLNDIVKQGVKAEVYKIDENVEVTGLSTSSENTVKGDLFFCLRGENFDGHNYASDAVRRGAVAVVTEKFMPKISCAQVVCEDTRLAYSYFSATFYGNPQKDLKIIGVVGTNGKTSTVKIIENVLKMHGKEVASIGTLGVNYRNERIEPTLTTPDPKEFFKILALLKSEGIKYVVTELSAHAIWLKKLSAVNFECLVFTNCTHDHLDYFSDFQSYRNVKKSAFNKTARLFAVNVDDPLGREIYNENPKKTITYGMYSPSDVFAIDVKERLTGVEFVLNMFDMVFRVSSKLCGEFNVYNVLASACACFLCGIKPEKIVNYIGKISPVEGRMEYVAQFNGAKIFVDYAHTPDGLNKSLSFIASVSEGKTCVVFGCGGDRDKTKRAEMGRIAADIADRVIITSDNPRYEDENAIISDVVAGASDVTSNFVIIPDRFSAVKYAVKSLSPDDILIITGKGAEEYIEKRGNKIPYSDAEAVRQTVEELNNNG